MPFPSGDQANVIEKVDILILFFLRWAIAQQTFP